MSSRNLTLVNNFLLATLAWTYAIIAQIWLFIKQNAKFPNKLRLAFCDDCSTCHVCFFRNLTSRVLSDVISLDYTVNGTKINQLEGRENVSLNFSNKLKDPNIKEKHDVSRLRL